MTMPPRTDIEHHTQYWLNGRWVEHREDGPSSVGLSTRVAANAADELGVAAPIFDDPPFAVCHWTIHGMQQRIVGRDLFSHEPKLVGGTSTGFHWSTFDNPDVLRSGRIPGTERKM